MTLRQLCNAAYASMVEHLDAAGRKTIDAELVALPRAVTQRQAVPAAVAPGSVGGAADVLRAMQMGVRRK